MFYQNELSFLCEVLKKTHVHTAVLEQRDIQRFLDAAHTGELLDQSPVWEAMLETLEPRTVYRLTDSYGRCYRFLLLPDTSALAVFYFGPFLSESLSPEKILEMGERHAVSPQKQRYLTEYYASLPVVSSDAHLMIMFHTFCERIWKNPSFEIKEITKQHVPAEVPVSQTMRSPEASDTLVNMKAIEQRYAFENEMIRAVSLGQPHMEVQFRSAFSLQFFEKRVSDPLRNGKNYGIIMNTLLRKAAEQGGVHPIYLDQVSSDFAGKIEKSLSLSDLSHLMSEMFRTYCRLVRKHSLQKFSPIVKKVILTIDGDLSVPLSPGDLAKKQGVSLGYLSTIFKKETGKTISEYIRARRLEYAAYLLRTTNLQIQTVALHCGIMDVQYFSKLFKMEYSKPPTEYRMEGSQHS